MVVYLNYCRIKKKQRRFSVYQCLKRNLYRQLFNVPREHKLSDTTFLGFQHMSKEPTVGVRKLKINK